jgi:hypothetical protein
LTLSFLQLATELKANWLCGHGRKNEHFIVSHSKVLAISAPVEEFWTEKVGTPLNGRPQPLVMRFTETSECPAIIAAGHDDWQREEDVICSIGGCSLAHV